MLGAPPTWTSPCRAWLVVGWQSGSPSHKTWYILCMQVDLRQIQNELGDYHVMITEQL